MDGFCQVLEFNMGRSVTNGATPFIVFISSDLLKGGSFKETLHKKRSVVILTSKELSFGTSI